MEIIIAEHSGLCYGVKRALNLARRTREIRSGSVATLGDLIHNPGVIADLKGRGIASAASPSEIKNGTVIIRSHGVSPKVLRSLSRRNLNIIDATCPIVKNIQKLVADLAAEEREIVLVGNRRHPEIRGLVGFAGKKCRVVENEAEARALPRRKSRAVLAQSTQDAGSFKGVVGALVENTDELFVHNTICRSTQTRQKSTSDLASRVDTLFIVGGRTSSNTRELFRISKRILSRTHFIENAGEITAAMLRGAKTIGISGGASTPPEAIQEAVARIRSRFKDKSDHTNKGRKVFHD